MKIHSYEDLEWKKIREAFKGTELVSWHGQIEKLIGDLIDDAEKSTNRHEVDQLRQFLQTWRENKITGSINRATLKTLESAASLLAVAPLKAAPYMKSIRDRLRQVIASEEELPRVEPQPAPKKSARPQSVFGPENEAPSEKPRTAPPPEGTEPKLPATPTV